MQVYYEKEDKLQLTDHLRSEHQAEDGLEYLMAGCLMNEDERRAIVNVIQDREPHYVGAEQPADTAAAEEEEQKEADTSDLSISALVPETTLQEVAEEVTEPGKVDTVDRSGEYFATNKNRKKLEYHIFQGGGGCCGQIQGGECGRSS